MELSQGTSGSGISSNSSEKRQTLKEQQQPKKLKTTAKEDGGKKSVQSTKSYSLHRSSHDGLSAKSTKVVVDNKRAQRTHSMEGGRKKRNGLLLFFGVNPVLV